MKLNATLIAVREMQRSVRFYREVLGLRVENDFGANVSLSGGLALQTLESWSGFIRKEENDIHFGGDAGELYFEAEDFDAFIARLQEMPDICYVHPAIEHAWGQRVVRFRDPDGHIIEVGEPLATVVRRFAGQGMAAEQIALRMDVPTALVTAALATP